ncbi:MAG: 16S rRNA (cytosine(967)-C(5))-methyltransferase RsmB, partial [Oscillospiraceae bacterium]|nr:16S rRNA (cytosine(967)-C(5))-methyltransferase RsmB [Oscillospiraceae bacterium]
MPSARNVAVKLLLRVEKGAYSNIILDNERSFSDLSDTDKKFTSRLFYGTIERKITLDYIISSYLSKPISKLDKEILMILRTGIYQLLYMPSVPDNAAVNESVKLATEFSKSSAKGMVNAILRNFIRNDKTFSLPKDEISSLSVKYSVPSELISKWIKDYGKEETEKILEGFSADENNITMRVNNTLISDDDFISEMKSMGIECIKSEILPHCVITSSFSGIENN